MTISDEAVERAAEAIFEVRDDPYDMDEWDELDSTDREPFTCQARVALEAAAPFIRAQALEDAADTLHQRVVNPNGSTKDALHLLRARAAVYKDHPDYRQEYSPNG